MWDVAYVLITLLFFAAMLWYVQGCKHLGDTSGSHETDDKRRASGGRRNGGGSRDER